MFLTRPPWKKTLDQPSCLHRLTLHEHNVHVNMTQKGILMLQVYFLPFMYIWVFSQLKGSSTTCANSTRLNRSFNREKHSVPSDWDRVEWGIKFICQLPVRRGTDPISLKTKACLIQHWSSIQRSWIHSTLDTDLTYQCITWSESEIVLQPPNSRERERLWIITSSVGIPPMFPELIIQTTINDIYFVTQSSRSFTVKGPDAMPRSS